MHVLVFTGARCTAAREVDLWSRIFLFQELNKNFGALLCSSCQFWGTPGSCFWAIGTVHPARTRVRSSEPELLQGQAGGLLHDPGQAMSQDRLSLSTWPTVRGAGHVGSPSSAVTPVPCPSPGYHSADDNSHRPGQGTAPGHRLHHRLW